MLLLTCGDKKSIKEYFDVVLEIPCSLKNIKQAIETHKEVYIKTIEIHNLFYDFLQKHNLADKIYNSKNSIESILKTLHILPNVLDCLIMLTVYNGDSYFIFRKIITTTKATMLGDSEAREANSEDSSNPNEEMSENSESNEDSENDSEQKLENISKQTIYTYKDWNIVRSRKDPNIIYYINTKTGVSQYEVPKDIIKLENNFLKLDDIYLNTKTGETSNSNSSDYDYDLTGDRIEDRYISKKCMKGHEIKSIIGSGAFGDIVSTCLDNDCRYAVKIQDYRDPVEISKEIEITEKLSEFGLTPKFYGAWTCITKDKEYSIIVTEKWDESILSSATKKPSKDIIDKYESLINTMHKLGYNHYDLFPKNVVVKKHGKKIIDIALIDFGISEKSEKKLSRDWFNTLYDYHYTNNPHKPTMLKNKQYVNKHPELFDFWLLDLIKKGNVKKTKATMLGEMSEANSEDSKNPNEDSDGDVEMSIINNDTKTVAKPIDLSTWEARNNMKQYIIYTYKNWDIVRSSKDPNVIYYINLITRFPQSHVPKDIIKLSDSWLQLDDIYLNTKTGEITKIPPAIDTIPPIETIYTYKDWDIVRSRKDPNKIYYFNTKTGASEYEAPKDIVKLENNFLKLGDIYLNTTTGETTKIPPDIKSKQTIYTYKDWNIVKSRKDPNVIYYANTKTGATQYEVPKDIIKLENNFLKLGDVYLNTKTWETSKINTSDYDYDLTGNRPEKRYISKKCMKGHEIKSIIGSGRYGDIVSTCLDNDCRYAVKIQDYRDPIEISKEIEITKKLSELQVTPKFYGAWKCITKDKVYSIIVTEKWDDSLTGNLKNLPKDIIDKYESLINTMHKLGYNHYDLFPKNIVVKKQGDIVTDIALIDFGISEKSDEKLSSDWFDTLYDYHYGYSESKILEDKENVKQHPELFDFWLLDVMKKGV
jgi:tRNA A-37 threonylcarbamoyl transferase component Bud32